MASYYKDGNTWTVSFRFKGLPRDYIYGIKRESIAKKAAQKKTLEEELARADLHTPTPNAERIAAAVNTPLEKHLEGFERSIIARGKVAQHAKQQAAHVRRIFKMASIRRIDRMEAESVQDAAKVLLDKEGLAPRTVNAALQACHQFGEWLRKTKRLAHNPLIDFERFSEASDTRRPRRELSDEELEYLLWHVETHGKRRSSISGPDRAMLYRVALYTGFRQSACLSLEHKNFNVDAKLTRPTIGLWAGVNKNRKYREQPIPRDVAAVFHAWLEQKPSGRVWKLPKHAHKELWMLRDLAAARASWIAEASGKARESREKSDFLAYRDRHGKYADFHGWRHTGISRVVRHAGLKAGQIWADHSSPVITAKYAHMNLTDEAKALEALPPATAAKDEKKKLA